MSAFAHTVPTPATSQARTRPRESAGSILVAADGSGPAAGALRAAQLLADRTGADVEVLSVLAPMPLVVPRPGAVSSPSSDPPRVQRLMARVKDQLADVVRDHSSWRTQVAVGEPADVIARTATERQARLVVTGVSRHGVHDRLTGAEVPARTAMLTDVPLLSAVANFELPTRVLVAVDAASPHTMCDAVPSALLERAAAVYFVHVAPSNNSWEPWPGWRIAYEDRAGEALSREEESILLPPDAQRERTVLEGDPARTILRFAAAHDVDLIIAGRRSRGDLALRLRRGLALRILREARCSVLLLPNRVNASAGADIRTESITEPERWPEQLALFTRRNTGRRARIEVDVAEIGAQSEARGYPFLGADYDVGDGRVHLMLGSRTTGGGHVMHSIVAPASIDVMECASADRALRILHPGGQTILAFLP